VRSGIAQTTDWRPRLLKLRLNTTPALQDKWGSADGYRARPAVVAEHDADRSRLVRGLSAVVAEHDALTKSTCARVERCSLRDIALRQKNVRLTRYKRKARLNSVQYRATVEALRVQIATLVRDNKPGLGRILSTSARKPRSRRKPTNWEEALSAWDGVWANDGTAWHHHGSNPHFLLYSFFVT
jgi:hypothetical protein